MGSVWRAEHLGWEAPVAVKLMNRDVAEEPEARARFEREVRLAAELRSPHVVQVLDHGVDETSRIPFITMELLEGESLEARLRRKGPLSPAETLEIVSQAVRGLSRAHEAGVVHRDLKPENLFLVRNEEQSVVKILDFGIAKGSRSNLAARLTRPGRVLGTPFYMSPEQFRGTREIDHRADLWSLSAITCECLTGKRPFEARDVGELALLLLRNTGRPLPSALGTVPEGFDAWFLRATHPEIEQRFQSARELGSTLARVCGTPAAQQLAMSPTEELPAESAALPVLSRLRSGARQRWTPARVASACLLALLPLGAGAFWQYQRERAAARAPAAGEAEMAAFALRPGPPSASSAPSAMAPPAPGPERVMAAPSGGSPPPAEVTPAASAAPPATSAEPAALAASPPVTPIAAPAVASAHRAAPSKEAPTKEAPRKEARAARHKGRSPRTSKPAQGDRTRRGAEEDPPAPIDVNGRSIRMTLDPLQ